MFFYDNIIPNIHDDILLSLLDYEEVYSTWGIQNIYGNTIWHDAGKYIKLDSFWDKVIDNILFTSWDIQNIYGDTVWHVAVPNIRLESFWNKVIDKHLYELWNIKNKDDNDGNLQ